MNSFLFCQVNGGWSSWSSWFTCEQTTGEKCQCRTRTCSQPIPQNNGQLCQGSNIEITRCEGLYSIYFVF